MLFLVKRFIPSYNVFMSPEKIVARLLIAQHKTLAIAESCTGGYLTHCLTNIPGSSKFLEAAVVAYSNKAKQRLLRIPAGILRQHGAVSKQIAQAMALCVRTIHQTDLGVAITGIAGPTGATKTKPVGVVYIAVSAPAKTLCLEYLFKGDRIRIKQKAVTQALYLLKKCLS